MASHRLIVGLLLAALIAGFTLSTFGADAPERANGLQPYTGTIPDSKVTFEMVPIPGGTFRIGSLNPVEVEVEPFFMGKYEVTWAEYNLFLQNYHRLAAKGPPAIPAAKMADAVTYPTPMYELGAGPILDRMGRGGEFPAVSMSQFDARQYTKWLSKKTGRFYRLPTDAEWEYACRAGTTTEYSFGDDPEELKNYAWYFDNSEKSDGENAYREVGKKKLNGWGLYDMHGNVAEWCIDQFYPSWYEQFNGLGKMKAEEVINWPNKKHPRVIRGGSFEHEAGGCRSTSRTGSTKDEVDRNNIYDLPESPHWSSSGFWIGFRLVSPAKEPTEAEKLRFWNADDVQTMKTVRERDARYLQELVEPSNKN